MASVLGRYEVSEDTKNVFPGMDHADLSLCIRSTIAYCGDHGVNVCGALIWIKTNTLKKSRLMT